MGGDTVRFVALDFVLGIGFGGVMGMAFAIEIARVHLDDLSCYVAGLGIPAHMIADLEFFGHFNSPLPGFPYQHRL